MTATSLPPRSPRTDGTPVETLSAPASTPAWLHLALLCAAQFMVVLDFSIVNVALPTIQQTYGLSQERLQWLVSGYALTFGGLLLLGGRAADLFGRRRLFVAGIIVFALASLLGGLAPGLPWLVAARALQGAAAAVLSPAALSLVTSLFHGRDRARALGIYGALGASGFAVGVFLGGLLTDGPGWRWVFFVNVPVGLIVAALTLRSLPADRPAIRDAHLDIPGSVAATGGLALLVYGLSEAPNWHWTSPLTWACLGLALVCLAVFVRIEARARVPLLRLRLLRSRRLAVANLVVLLTTAAVAPQVFVMTLFLQGVQGFTASQTGLLFLAQGASAVLGAVLGSRAIARFGARWLMATGRFIATMGFAMLLPLPGRDNVLGLAAALGLVGLGNVCTIVSCSVAATYEVDATDMGVASGMLYTSQQVGSALGVSVLVALAATRTGVLQDIGLDRTPALVEGFRWTLAGCVTLGAIATLSALAAPRRPGLATNPTGPDRAK